MKRLSMGRTITIVLVGTAASMAASVWAARANTQPRLGGATGAMFPAYQATFLSSSELINPEELVKILQSPNSPWCKSGFVSKNF